MATAAALRDAGHGERVTYSPKVFVPLTRLCRDVCHYCTFAAPPRRGEPAYLSLEAVLAIARAGAAAGCTEALFTLGDRPERRYRAAREALTALGHATTLAYLAEAARTVFTETGLLPHLNPGVMTAAEIAALRPVAASMGLMLESVAAHLSRRGGPHFGSPDKRPEARLATLAAAGEAVVPFTTGILIGIGEVRAERIAALLAIRDLDDRYGHIQEVIVQPFRAKRGTRMAGAAEPSTDDLLWTVAMARIVLGPAMSIQSPPNLSPGGLARLIAAGVDDWGGVSPVTRDHVNPEAPWPAIEALAKATAAAGKRLVARLPVHPRFVHAAGHWLAPGMARAVLDLADADGLARDDRWAPGEATAPPGAVLADIARRSPAGVGAATLRALDAAREGNTLSVAEIVRLLGARGADFAAVCAAADALRAATVGERVSFVVNRNLNYTNVCAYRCGFCAFSKGARRLAGRAYVLDADEIARRVAEAWERGATEVCMQGGIHPAYSGETYLAILATAKRAAPGIHVHAFSPLEVWHGATTLGLGLADYLARLAAAGLGSLPGTAAEILDDRVRRVICPDKLTAGQWLAVMRAAHGLGLASTATMMFGHVERPEHWARHLLAIRALAAETGRVTEFVPLPFIPMEAPIYRRGAARRGPTFRECVAVHAVARLVLHPHVVNIQASWVKLGAEGTRALLDAGVNDLGGTLMNESISRAAGATHGQEMGPAAMEALIRAAGRVPWQRTTLYAPAPAERRAAALAAPPLGAPREATVGLTT